MPQTKQFLSAVEKFLSRLSDKSVLTIPAYHVAIVVAEPDDATNCGATLARLKGAQVVVVTDGVRRAPGEAASYSFQASRAPEIVRWRELTAALALAGCPSSAVTGLAVPQGNAAENVLAVSRRLADLFHRAGTAVAITHAYEGADSDVDATAFAVHGAVALCRGK